MREASSRVGREAAVAVGTAAPLTLIAFAQGGYFPTTWGWAAVGFWWAVVVALLLRRENTVTLPGAIALCALGCLALWTATSVLWSSDVTSTVLETERVMAYTAALAAFLLVPHRSHAVQLVAGVFTCGVIVCAWALGTRLFPETLGYSTLPFGPGRLFAPVGYWNALGMFAAVTVLLALAYIEREAGFIRLVAAAVAPVAVCVLYLTFSRGAVACLVIGALVWLALCDSRLRLILLLILLAPVWLVPVAVARSLPAVTRPDLSLSAATHDGRRLAVVMGATMVASAMLALVFTIVERRYVPGQALRRAFGMTIVVCLLAALIFEIVEFGSPATQVSRATSDFTSAPPAAVGGPSRLTSLSLNNRNVLWSVAWHEYTSHPAVGSGAGTFAQFWVRERTAGFASQWAHSLYLGELAELGPVGLVLVVVIYAAALFAAVVMRREPLGPATSACLVAFAAHAGFDWDWQLPALTMSALALIAYPLVASGTATVRVGLWANRLLVAGAVCLLGVSALGLAANIALAKGRDAFGAGNLAVAKEDAQRAKRLAPWSDEPWALLGQAMHSSGEQAGARRAFGRWVDLTPGDWAAWAALAEVTSSTERARAAIKACELNPLGSVLGRPCYRVAARAPR